MSGSPLLYAEGAAAVGGIAPAYDLRDYQGEDVDATMAAFESGKRAVVACLATGLGKAQPLSEPVLTPDGWRVMGSIRAGDQVIGVDGKCTRVVAVHPQGEIPVFEVTFTDGTSTRCCGNHLWTVQTKSQKARHSGWKTLRTADLIGDLTDGSGASKWFLPVVEPVQFRERPVPIDPYVLGVILGDGGCKYTSVGVTSADEFVVAAVGDALPSGAEIVPGYGKYQYTIRGTHGRGRGNGSIRPALKEVGILGLGCEDKHIPSLYLYNSVAVRLGVLRGLMDTDGTVRAKDGHVEFCTVSRRLAGGVCHIVRSLGGVTRVRTKAPGRFTHKGESGVGRESYRVTITLRGINPFRLPRKADLYNPDKNQGQTKAIRSIEPVGVDECQCITVGNPDGLYITRAFTVTHNSVYIAELAKKLSAKGRVLVVVDVGNLADDLAQTAYRHLGGNVGILTGKLKEGYRRSKVVVCTVQTLYAGGNAAEWFRQFNPADFAAVLVDECESSIAEKFSGAVRYFLDGNPNLVICGCSATPFRGDGRGMGELYDHAADAPGPLSRDILWGRDNGWLVHVRQAFVRVSLDFSTLSVRKNEDGEQDYTEAGLAEALEQEQTLIELAKGIHEVAKLEPSIVICPNSVALAKALAHYLDGEHRGCAHAVYGAQGKAADVLLTRYKRGDYPYIVSVNKLYKGFDADRVRFVFMCRKTKSKRLYSQALGRGTRPLTSIREALNAAPDADARRCIIASSPKPHMVMVDMVGLNDAAKDIGVIDILNPSLPEHVRQRAKKRMAAEAGAQQDTDQAGREAEREAAEEAAREREEAERRRRQIVQVKANVDVEYTDDHRVSRGGFELKSGPEVDPRFPHLPPQHVSLLLKGGVPHEDVKRMGPKQAGDVCRELVRRWKLGLASWKQCAVLRRAGYSRDEVHNLKQKDAHRLMDELKAAKWKRPHAAEAVNEVVI